MAVQRSKVDERIFRTAPLLRSSRLLQDLPVEYRWGVMRRHPYYVQLWEPGLNHLNGVCVDVPSKAIGKAAVLILQGIGFTGKPVPPNFEPVQQGQRFENGVVVGGAQTKTETEIGVSARGLGFRHGMTAEVNSARMQGTRAEIRGS